MKSENFSKIKEVLASSPDDVALLKEAGIIGEEVLQELQPHSVTAGVAAKYYDLNKVKTEILDEVGGYDLKDIEFEPGRYEIAYDFLGSLETAIRTFGLVEIGIMETESGYKFGEQEASSIEELDGAEQALTQYADQIARDLSESLGLPGVFYFGFNSDFGDGAFRLFYAFEDQDLQDLRAAGADIQMSEQEEEIESSFEHIIATLEHEGCHEMALRLHAILRES